MDSINPALLGHLLQKLKTAKGNRLGKARLAATPTVLTRFGATPEQGAAALEELVHRHLVTERRAGGGVSYQLNPAGEEFLRTAQPQPPEVDPHLLPYQRSFVLLQFLRLGNRDVTPTEVAGRLDTRDAKSHLGLGKVPGGDPAGRLVLDRELVGWLLNSMAAAGSLRKRETRRVAYYRLTEAGEELLGASEQYPSIKFTLKGEELTRYAEVVRAAGRNTGRAAPEPVSVPAPPTRPTAEIVLEQVGTLLRTRYERDGMVPIHELRRAVRERLGADAASHESLDPVLRDLRRQRKVRLVAIGDLSDATPEQLADSLPGDNETFFSIEPAHEFARVG